MAGKGRRSATAERIITALECGETVILSRGSYPYGEPGEKLTSAYIQSASGYQVGRGLLVASVRKLEREGVIAVCNVRRSEFTYGSNQTGVNEWIEYALAASCDGCSHAYPIGQLQQCSCYEALCAECSEEHWALGHMKEAWRR